MPKTAVIGASGIGKHHAKWWALEGADLCAFAGTSPDSVARTRESLEQLFGFRGRGWTDVSAMLRGERPDFLDVCSPNPRHFEHVRAGLEAGCHVLCEKPFVYSPELPPDRILDQVRELIRLARERDRRIGLCAQYAFAGRFALEAFRRQAPESPLRTISMELASPGRGRPADPLPIWIDLGPHLLAAIQTMFPGAELRRERLECEFRPDHAEVRFLLETPAGEPVQCRLVAGRTRGEPGHIRRIAINDYPCNFLGANDEHGVYCTRIATPDGERLEPDMMRLLIRKFLNGESVTGPAFILRNMEWLLLATG